MLIVHEAMLKFMPARALQNVHGECCRLRKGGENINDRLQFIFEYPVDWFVMYHFKVMGAAMDKGIWIRDENWLDPAYRGKKLVARLLNYNWEIVKETYDSTKLIYPDHNQVLMAWQINKFKNRNWPITEEDKSYLLNTKFEHNLRPFQKGKTGKQSFI